MTRRYEASIRPARPGDHEFLAVAYGFFPDIEEAVGGLMLDPDLEVALLKEDPRLEDWFGYEDECWTEGWPERAQVVVEGPESDGDTSPDYPFVLIRSTEQLWSYKCRNSIAYAGCQHRTEDRALRCAEGDMYATYRADVLGGERHPPQHIGSTPKGG